MLGATLLAPRELVGSRGSGSTTPWASAVLELLPPHREVPRGDLGSARGAGGPLRASSGAGGRWCGYVCNSPLGSHRRWGACAHASVVILGTQFNKDLMFKILVS